MTVQPGEMILHGYWRSGTSYRVRIALGLKGLACSQVTHDLRLGEQRARGYLALQPQGLVPALEVPGGVLTQSGAIIEWLEEVCPDPPLLPSTPLDRAIVRAMATLIACDIHPLNNLRVLQFLRGELSLGEDDVSAWITRWISDGFAGLERLLEVHAGAFCFGNSISLADCHLVPQVYSAERFGVSLDPFPVIRRVVAGARGIAAVAAAHPDRQPDADPGA